MDLFDIKLRLVRLGDQEVILWETNCLHLSNIKLSGSDPIPPEVTIESRSTTLKSFELSRKSGVPSLLHSFEVSIFIYSSFVPLITGKIASFTGKRSFSRLQSMSKDGMSRDGRKISPVHVTLKAGVINKFLFILIIDKPENVYGSFY